MTEPILITNPYVGPRTFERAQRHLFFGREREARDLLARVVSQRLTLFYAQSGVGKSSLVNTRLIPQLEQEAGFAVLPVGRISGALPAGVETVDNIFVFNLMLRLNQDEDDPQRFAHLTLSDFLAHLVSDDGQTFRYVATATAPPASQPSEAAPYVLIIDQFEEIITTHLDRWQARRPFFQQLNQAMLDDPNLWVVLVLREDYVASLDPFAGLMAERMRARFYMQRMETLDALAAVQQPAKLGNRPFAPGVAEALVDNLRRIKMLEQEGDQLGQFVEPVQLQVVCYQLWENLKDRPLGLITHDDLQQAGDIDNALGTFYEEVIAAALRQGDGKIAERFLRQWFDTQLITETNTRGAVYQGLTETAGIPNPLVQLLTRQFLLRLELRAGGAWIELVHDRFIEPIRRANQRWFAQYQNPLVEATQSWLNGGNDPTRLLTEANLVTAQQWATANPHDLSVDEQEFLAESLRQAQARLEQARQAAQRRRQLTLASLFVIAILTLLAGWALANAQQAHEQRDRAVASARRAFAEELAANAQSIRESHAYTDATLALLLARQAVFTSLDANEPPTINAQLALQRVVDHAPPWRMTLPQARHEGAILWIAYSPTGKLIATAGEDQTIRLWDATTGEQVHLLTGHMDQVWSVQFSADGRRLVSASWDDTARIWDVATGVELQRLAHNQALWWAAFSPDDSTVVTVADDRVTRVWDLATGHEKATFRGHDARVFMAQFSPNGEQLVTASADGTAKLWQVRTGQRLQTFAHPSHNWIFSAQFNHAGTQVVTASADGTARVWDISTGLGRLPLFVKWGWCKFATFSHDDQILVTTGEYGQVALWDAHSGQERSSLVETQKMVNAAAFDPHDQTVWAAGDDGAIRVWRADSGVALPWFQGHTDAVNLVRFSLDGQRLASASADRTVALWDMPHGRLLAHLTDHEALVTALEFSRDGHWLLTASADTKARLWSAITGKLIYTLQGHSDRITQAHFSADSRRVVTASDDGSVRLWEVATGAPVGAPFQQGDPVSDAEFNPDGSLLVAAGENKQIKLWNVVTGKVQLIGEQQAAIQFARFDPSGDKVATIGEDGTICIWQWRADRKHCWHGHSKWITDLAFDPTGALLATGSADHTARLWDVQSGVEKRVFSHDDTVTRIVFTHDGHGLLTASVDRNGRLWDIETGEERIHFTGHTAPVEDIAISPDDQVVATASNDFTLRLWQTHTTRAERQLRGHKAAVTAVGLAANDALALTASADRTVRLWDLTTSIPRIEFTRHLSPVLSAAISPDGAFVLSGDAEGKALLWRTSDGMVIHVLAGHTSAIRSVVFSPDGQLVATASEDHKTILWSVQEGRPLYTLAGHEDTVVGVAFRPDSKAIVTASLDQTVRLWDVQTGRELTRIQINTGPLVAVAFRPDGQVVALAHKDAFGHNFVSFWQIAQQRLWNPFDQLGYTASVTALTFSADGRLLLTASADGTAQLWDIATAQEIRRLQLEEGAAAFTSVAMRPDGEIILGGNDSNAYLWPSIDGLLHQAQTLIQRQPPAFWAPERRRFNVTDRSLMKNPIK